MPLNVRRFFASISIIFSGLILAGAQTVPTNPNNSSPAGSSSVNPANPTAPPVTVAPAPSAGDIMRDRISKAKAFIAVRNYNAAIYELENIRRETNDPALSGVINVLLMNSYLEQGDYKRAQDFLNDFYKAQTANKPNAAAQYLTVAAQIVKGGRNQLERYRALGLSVSDRNLPLEASVDLQKMRDTLETVIEQSKAIGKDKKQTASAMALLEEATNTRGSLAKDDYDAKRWKEEVSDAREELANSRTVILNTDGTTQPKVSSPSTAANSTNPPVSNSPNRPADGADNPQTNETVAVFKPVAGSSTNPPVRNPSQTIIVNENTSNVDAPQTNTPNSNSGSSDAPRNNSPRPRTIENNSPNQPENNGGPTNAPVKDGSPLNVGSLLAYATKQSKPNYPIAAKSMRTTGIVTVEVTVDEAGEVAEVQKTEGPAILQGAAKDAVKKWKFKPFVRDGQPVRATGFVSFNFAL